MISPHLLSPHSPVTLQGSATLNLCRFPERPKTLSGLRVFALQDKCSSIQVSQGSGVAGGREGTGWEPALMASGGAGAQLYCRGLGGWRGTTQPPTPFPLFGTLFSLFCLPGFPSGSG